MMKILHTSDWHIGQHFYRFDREDEHRHFFGRLCEVVTEERPDVMVVCGDVFHNPAPSAAAKQLFVKSVLALRKAAPEMAIVITAGNHDSGTRLEAERELWSVAGVTVIGSCARECDGTFDSQQFIVEVADKGVVLAVPYFHSTNYPLASAETERDNRQKAFFEKLLGEVKNTEKPVVMMAHLAVDGCNTRGHEDEPVGGMLKDNLTELGCGYDYLALGHIHMPQEIDGSTKESPKTGRIFYSGSVIPVSFSEDYPHSVNVVEIGKHGDVPAVRTVEIEALRKVKTIPVGGAPLEDALKALQEVDDEDNSYIRLLVDQDEPLPADAEDRANLVSKDKACRFCDVIKKPRAKVVSDENQIEVHDVEDLKNYSPLDIALRSYEKTNGAVMNDELKAMMQQAIDDIVNG